MPSKKTRAKNTKNANKTKNTKNSKNSTLYFYKGQGCPLIFQNGDDTHNDMVEVVMTTYPKKPTKECVEEMYSQLNIIYEEILLLKRRGLKHDTMDKNKFIIWIMNVVYLVEKGIMKNDDNNGYLHMKFN